MSKFKSNVSKELQNSNIPDISSTSFVLKEVISTLLKEMHPLNIFDIFTTLFVSKNDKSKYIIDSQL